MLFRFPDLCRVNWGARKLRRKLGGEASFDRPFPVYLVISVLTVSVGLALAVPAFADRKTDCFQSKDFNRQIKGCTEIIKRGKKETRKSRRLAYYYRGKGHYEKRQYDRAIADYTKAIELNPKFADAYNFRGIAYRKIGQYDRAIADHTKMIELVPEFAGGYINRGSVFVSKGEYDRAISDFSKAIELKPKFYYTYYLRGYAYIQMGQFDRAFDDYTKEFELGQQAQELEPKNRSRLKQLKRLGITP